MKNIASIALILILCSCADRPDDKAPGNGVVSGQVQIAPGLVLEMPGHAALGRPVEVTQLITAHYGDQSFAFECHISATPEHFLLIGLDLMGRKIITIDWTKDRIAYEKAPWVPPQLRPENILADIVLLYWPDAVVRQALSASSGKLVAGLNTRTITHDGKKVWRAVYEPVSKHDPWSGRVHYRNLGWNYEFEVQSAETSP